MPKSNTPSFQSSSDIANYHMNLTDQQAIEELKRMGIIYSADR